MSRAATFYSRLVSIDRRNNLLVVQIFSHQIYYVGRYSRDFAFGEFAGRARLFELEWVLQATLRQHRVTSARRSVISSGNCSLLASGCVPCARTAVRNIAHPHPRFHELHRKLYSPVLARLRAREFHLIVYVPNFRNYNSRINRIVFYANARYRPRVLTVNCLAVSTRLRGVTARRG